MEGFSSINAMPRSTNQNQSTDEEELASEICGINISNVRLFV